MKPFLKHYAAVALTLAMFGAQPALALPFNFSGSFAEDDDVQFFTITVSGGSTQISIDSSSYLSSTGFLPGVALWDSSGVFQASAAGSDGNGALGDLNNALSTTSLAAGTYWLALYEHPNNPNGQDLIFNSGIPGTSIFQYDGQGNFTGAYSGANYCLDDKTDGFYVSGNPDCEKRTNAWALSIDASNGNLAAATPFPAPVPEPATLALTLAGLAGFVPFARRRSAHAG